METPVKYLGQIDIPAKPKNKREKVLNSAYFQCVASTCDSIIMGNGLNDSSENHDWVIETAIAFTDQLIQKVEEKM